MSKARRKDSRIPQFPTTDPAAGLKNLAGEVAKVQTVPNLNQHMVGSGHIRDVTFAGDRVLDIDDPNVWMGPLRNSVRSEVGDKLANDLSERRLLLRFTSAVRERLRRP